MGRGGRKSSRSILLGPRTNQAPLETGSEIFTNITTSPKGRIETLIDSEGNRIVRDYDDRNLWVEKKQDSIIHTTTYAYLDPGMDNDPVGDGITIRQVINIEGSITEKFMTSDKHLLVRSPANQDDPVLFGDKHQRWRWLEGEDIFEKSENTQINGDGLEEEFIETTKNSKYHSLNNQPAIVEKREGIVVSEEWRDEGRVHRDGAPAIIEYTGVHKEAETWYQDDQIYNPDGASQIVYHTGSDEIHEKKFFYKDEKHGILPGQKNGSPALITYYPDGNIKGKFFFNGDKKHRVSKDLDLYSRDHQNELNQASKITYYYDGTPKLIEYRGYEGLHRTDGPARIKYGSDGVAKEKTFFLNGQKYSEHKFWEQVENLES